MTANLNLFGSATGGGLNNGGFVDLDFSNTAVVTTIDLRDASDGHLIQHLTFTGESGAVYPFPAVTAVPAPATFALLAVGVLVAGLVRRRR